MGRPKGASPFFCIFPLHQASLVPNCRRVGGTVALTVVSLFQRVGRTCGTLAAPLSATLSLFLALPLVVVPSVVVAVVVVVFFSRGFEQHLQLLRVLPPLASNYRIE